MPPGSANQSSPSLSGGEFLVLKLPKNSLKNNSYAIIYIMEPTNRSNVGNSTGGQNLPPVNNAPQPPQPVPQPGYDPIFSPTGRAGIQQASVTPTIISGSTTPPPDPNHTASTATGDILLSKSPSTSKSKLPLVIGLVAAIILVIAGFIFLMVNPFGKGSTTSPAASFNKFINYLYDSSDSTTTNANIYVEDSTFTLEEMLASDDQDARITYFTTAQQLLNDANNSLQNNNITADQQNLLNSISQNLTSVIEVASVSQLTNAQLTKYYLSNGAEATRKYMLNHYQKLTDSQNELTAGYSQDLITYDYDAILLLYVYQQNNCIANGALNYTCVNSLDGASGVQTLESAMTALDAKLDTRLSNYAATIINSAIQLGSSLNGIDYDLQKEYNSVS